MKIECLKTIRFGYFFLSLFLVITLISGCGDREERTYKRGLSLARRKKYDQAEVEIRRLIRLNPDNARAHNALGQIYRAQNLYTKAIEELTLSVEMSKTDPELPYNLGCLYRDLENLSRAADYYHQAIEIDPKFSPALYRLGAIYVDQGEPRPAEKYFRDFLNSDPERPAPGHNNLGVLLWADGRREEAIAELKEALSLEPELPDALYNFGVASLAENEKDPAGVKSLLAYLKARPHAREGPRLKRILLRSGAVSSGAGGIFSRDEYLDRGREYEDAGQYHPAVREYHRALRLDPDSSRAHYRLGIIYDQFLGDRANALHHYEIFLRGNKNSSHAPEVISRLEELRERIGSEVIAGGGLINTPSPAPSPIPEMAEVSEAPSFTGEEYFRKGEELRKKGDLKLALDAYNQSRELSPSQPRTYLGIGIVSLDQGKYNEAVAALLKARSLDQGQPVKKYLTKAYLRLAAGALSSHNFLESIGYCKKARAEGSIKQADEGLWKSYHAGFRDSSAKKNYSAAAGYLKLCLELKPDVADDYLALGDLYTRDLGNKSRGERYYAKYLELAPRGKAAARVKDILRSPRPDAPRSRSTSAPRETVKPSAVEHYNRGARYQRAGQYESARKEYSQAINLKPDFYQAYYNLGIIYNKSHRPSRALAAYKKAAGLKPDFARAQLAIFNLYYYHYKMKNLARPYAERYVKLAPGTSQAAELSKWLKK